MKIIKSLILILMLSLLAVAVYFIIDLYPGGPIQDLFKGSQTTAVTSLLKEIESMAQLNLAEYRIQAVYPYDYLPKDVDWPELKSYYNFTSRERAVEVFGEENVVHYETSISMGLDPGNLRYDFLMITAEVYAGYDLEEWLEDKSDNMREEQTEERIILYVKLPQPEILDIVIIDRNQADEGYPDTEVEPEQLQKLALELMPLVEQMALDKGILEIADDEGESLLKSLFLGAGYSEVVFE